MAVYRTYLETEQWFSLQPAPTERSRPRGVLASGWVVIGGFTLLTLAWVFYHAVVQPYWLTQLPAWVKEFIQLLEMSAFLTLLAVWGILIWQNLRPQTPAVPPLPTLDLDHLFTFSPGEFEHYVATLFQQKGYVVKRRGRTGDKGVDLELLGPGNRKAIVQCKRYQNTVGAELVRELYGTLMHEKALHAFLITTADISSAAREWAQGKPITLIDGATLMAIAAALESSKQ